MDIQWTEVDDETGEKRWYKAARFAGHWTFRMRTHRRGDSKRVHPTRAMWEEVLENLERRYRRREGVDEDDLKQVQKILAEFPPKPELADD